MSQRQMHLVAFLMTGPTCHHHGAWRHRETDIGDILSPARYEHIARVLEAGCFDALFFAVVIGETESIARERAAYVNSLVDTELGLAQISGHIGLDLSKYDPAEPLADVALEVGSRGSFDVILQGTEAEGLTLGEAARRFATSELCPQVVGTPETVADCLTDLFESEACDGFILTPTTFPGIEQFCKTVVPLLQQRGVFRKHYTGTSLREHLRG
jgi:hypothetical protein